MHVTMTSISPDDICDTRHATSCYWVRSVGKKNSMNLR
jgi:hypothetical protein